MNQYWYKEWETKLLEHEEDAEERLFLQPHLGVHTMTPELAASRGRLEARIGARRVMEQDTESWLGLRAERIAVFRRKLQARRVPVPGYRVRRDGQCHGRGRLHPHPQRSPAGP